MSTSWQGPIITSESQVIFGNLHSTNFFLPVAVVQVCVLFVLVVLVPEWLISATQFTPRLAAVVIFSPPWKVTMKREVIIKARDSSVSGFKVRNRWKVPSERPKTKGVFDKGIGCKYVIKIILEIFPGCNMKSWDAIFQPWPQLFAA